MMLYPPQIIGAVYNADIYCIACAEQTFGQSLYDTDCRDSEGNAPGFIDDGQELSPRGEYCGSCGTEISEPYLPFGYEIFHHDRHDHPITDIEGHRLPEGFYWWACHPRCSTEGDLFGPFETEEEALADLLEDYQW